jgi:hypothetical protein
MADVAEQVLDLIFGRWRSQILYVGVALGVFDHLAAERATGTTTLASEIGADPALLYRLLRALASLGLLAEEAGHVFRLTEAGALLQADRPQSLRAMALLEEGPEHYAIWKHLLSILRDGRQDGFTREFGMGVFEYAREHPHYAAVFNDAMTEYSRIEAQWALAALDRVDFSRVGTLCDVGGGHGDLACKFLGAYPHLAGIVFDLPEVVAQTERLWAPRQGLAARCRYIGGDMFQQVPTAGTPIW